MYLVPRCLLSGVLVNVGAARAADHQVDAVASIRFGILPIGSAAESREQSPPLLDDPRKRLGHPVTTVSVSRYAGFSGAIGAQRVDVAFPSGQLAIEAMTRQHMQVFAQFVRGDGARGNVAMLGWCGRTARSRHGPVPAKLPARGGRAQGDLALTADPPRRAGIA